MDDSSLSPLVVASASVTAPAPLVNGAIPQVDDSIILPELTAQILDTAPVGTPAPQPGRPDAVVNAMQLVPSGPGYPTEPNLRLFLSLIQNATRRVSITSPYFIPDEALLSAMTTAAYRGVEVELFVGQESDQFIVNHAQRSYYSALLAAGVRIYRYPAPTVLHAKYMTVDGEACVIGSANMDFRSFALNYEVMLLAFGGDLDDLLRENDAHYREISTELTAAQWAREPWWSKYIDNVCRLMSSVL
jgi:cardiolipin synthetase